MLSVTTEPTGHRNPIARTISTRNEWEALPVGALARVGYIDHAEDGSDIDGGIMFAIRVDGDIQTKAGDYMLAGGRYWSETWGWENSVTVADLDALLPDRTGPEPVPGTADAVSVIETAIAAHTKRHEDMMQMPVRKYRLIPADELPPVSPASAVLEALTSRGWAPAARLPGRCPGLDDLGHPGRLPLRRHPGLPVPAGPHRPGPLRLQGSR